MKVDLYHNPFPYVLSVTLTPSLLNLLLQHVLQASYLHCLLPHVVSLSHDERLVKRDRRTRCKHPEILSLVRNQQRYGRAAHTTSPATERDRKSGKEFYSSVYSSIASLILYDGHTTYVYIALMCVIAFVFAIILVFDFVFVLVSVVVVICFSVIPVVGFFSYDSPFFLDHATNSREVIISFQQSRNSVFYFYVNVTPHSIVSLMAQTTPE
jgi:hypothetical protein